ncbi:MAG TPA: hypothetical protein VG889_10790 [Rhizomicrobium sp.]|nr:hypothetical protein [Rhizomicrobium sp.]
MGVAATKDKAAHTRPLSDRMVELILALSASTEAALHTADEEAKVEGYRYDSRGRFRDHEIDVAVRLGNTSARLADILVKIAAFNDASGWKPREL